MSEFALGAQFCIALVMLVLASFLYMWGGRNLKIIRRLGGAAVLSATVNILFAIHGTWSPYYLITLPLLFGGFSMGYGGTDVTSKKILRRSIYALGVMSSGVLCAYLVGGGAWILLIAHIGIGLFSVLLGTRNVLPAAVEEPLICVLLNLCLICYPFIP